MNDKSVKLKTPFLPTAFLTKRSEVYKKCIFDQKFWAKMPWSEMYKNCISDQIQWSEITKISDDYCSIKIFYQKKSQQSWTAVRCVQEVHLLSKILGENTSVRNVQKLRF